MKVINTVSELKSRLTSEKVKGKKIGFVPTMGALHQGHIELVKQSVAENNITVVSIFVNPIQFNNKTDLDKYPRDLNKDIALLDKINCDIVFSPSEKEMYPDEAKEKHDLGGLDTLMEGQFRPGHFQGVAIVVKRFFDLVQPDKAYFGQKDFQQLSIIKHLTRSLNLPLQIVTCETIRGEDGLAMSSRNLLLENDFRKEANIIPNTLFQLSKWKENLDVNELKERVKEVFSGSSLELEYFEIVDEETLQPIDNWQPDKNIVACIAAWAGKVRLIDNIKI